MNKNNNYHICSFCKTASNKITKIGWLKLCDQCLNKTYKNKIKENKND